MLTTLLCIVLTFIVYVISRKLMIIYPSPFTTPVFFSTIVIISILVLFGITGSQYEETKSILTSLLGPATVALAVPLYRNVAMIKKYWKSAGLAFVTGLCSSIVVAEVILRLFSVSEEVLVSMQAKSATVPIALEIISITGGNAPLTTAFVVATGMIGTMLGPWVLNALKVTNPVTRGVALGTLSHGQGTAQAATEGQLQGAVAGVCMGLSAIVLSFILPMFMM